MTAKQTETALLTEHLRYTPLSLVDDIINTVNELSSRAVDAAEEGLLAADPSQLGFPKSKADGDDVRERARVEIEEGVHQLETLLEANIDRKFDMFEILVLRNVLAIHPPELVPWIRLPHYDPVFSPAAQAADAVTPDDLRALRRRVREARKLNRALRAAAARADADVRRIRALIQPAPPAPPSSDDPPDNDDANAGALAFLTAGRGAEQLGIAPSLLLPEWAGDGATAAAEVGPLETNASFALSQLPALRDLLRQLRPRLEALSADESTREAAPPPADESAAARERRLYVEAQATRAVRRRLRGGALDGDGGGEAASTEGAGRAVSLEELAALEALVEEFNRPGDDAMEA